MSKSSLLNSLFHKSTKRYLSLTHNSQKMLIRKFQDKDAVKVAKLHRDTIRTINAKDYSLTQIKRWSGEITAQGHRKYAKLHHKFVAVKKERIIGFADYQDDELHGLYIHKDHTNKGIGNAFVTKIENAIRKKGFKSIKVTSTITARSFYERNGFKVVRKTLHRGLIVYEMKKNLATKPNFLKPRP